MAADSENGFFGGGLGRRNFIRYGRAMAGGLMLSPHIGKGGMTVNRPAEEENISLLDRINNSTNTKELKSWELLIKVEKDNIKKQVLQDAYNIKMAALISNQPAHETK